MELLGVVVKLCQGNHAPPTPFQGSHPLLAEPFWSAMATKGTIRSASRTVERKNRTVIVPMTEGKYLDIMCTFSLESRKL